MNSDKKMAPEQLMKWLAIRKKCSTFKSKKDYTRKEKHKGRGMEEQKYE